MRYQRKPSTVEAAQVAQDLTLPDGTAVPAGYWLVIRADGHSTACSDTDFAAEYEPAPAPEPVAAPVEAPVDVQAEEPAPA